MLILLILTYLNDTLWCLDESIAVYADIYVCPLCTGAILDVIKECKCYEDAYYACIKWRIERNTNIKQTMYFSIIHPYKIKYNIRTLLNISANDSNSCRRQPMRQNNNPPLLSSLRIELIISHVAWMVATTREPKQIGPKDVVMLRQYESRTAEEQHDVASSGTHHHVPTVPATVQCTTFLMTWQTQK